MSEPKKEHPAAVAGRYLRAAGLAIARDLERRADDADRIAEEKRREEAERAARPPEPAIRPRPLFDRLLWLVFVLSLIALALTALQAQMLFSGETEDRVRIALGILLALGGFPLLTNWLESTDRIVDRLFKKVWGIGEARGRGGRWARRFARDGMMLLAIILLALAVYQILTAFVA